MREIKFRAWTNIGSFKKPVQAMVYASLEELYGGELSDGTHICDSFALMQYTGLKDKNGKEIYEGDIVMYPDHEDTYVDVGIGGHGIKVNEVPINSFFPVEFRHAEFGIEVKQATGERLTPQWYSIANLNNELGQNQLENIGNIHENPELLGSH